MKPIDGRKRLVIEGVRPEIDGGRFAAKRTVGEAVVVEADIFTDGHDALSAVLLYRKEGESGWEEVPMRFLMNDRWQGEFSVAELGRYQYTIQAWVDYFKTWRSGQIKKAKAGVDTPVGYLIAAQFMEEAAARAAKADAEKLRSLATELRKEKRDLGTNRQTALGEELLELMSRYPDRRLAGTYEKELPLLVEPVKARFSTWYEFFPRSTAKEPGRHGTFKDGSRHLEYVAAMGFDVVYFPPIHPTGLTHRKGRNNSPLAEPGDVGSPWGIGSAEGGHKSIHPQLGTLNDFRSLVKKAESLGIEVALDIAFQCSPDHPYVKGHPEWFRWRPDGTVQFAENPPKKYQDIYPLEFDTDQWRELWDELKSVILYWVEQGIRIFRVDNPHTKPFRFWEWVIGEIKKDHPDTIFLAEAFTRPKVMGWLAKAGFSQSYTYFAWRNTKSELTQYFTELTQTEVREFFRPNLWPNTPDILTEHLQHGGRQAFQARLVLAATLGASYGIYGPAFELCENQPREPGSEEYYNSEKYEIKQRDLDRPDSLKHLIGQVNRVRRDNPALHSDWSLRFHAVDNDQLICYSKRTKDFSNVILVIVNLDPHHIHSGWVNLDLAELGLEADRPFQVQDLLTNAHFLWNGPRNYVELNPDIIPAHILKIHRRTRTERDFDYYM